MKKESYTFTENEMNKGILSKLRTLAKADGRNFASYLAKIFTKHVKDENKENIK